MELHNLWFIRKLRFVYKIILEMAISVILIKRFIYLKIKHKCNSQLDIDLNWLNIWSIFTFWIKIKLHLCQFIKLFNTMRDPFNGNF